MSNFYHPLTGSIVSFEEFNQQEAYIDDRLYRPSSWQIFVLPDEADNVRTFGVEIELNITDRALKEYQSRDFICAKLLEVLNRDGKHFHIMRDNSVRSGIELVSSPMSYQYFVETFDAVEISALLSKYYLAASHDSGLHFHVGMRHSLRERELILRMFATTYPLWLLLSRRNVIRLEHRYVSSAFINFEASIRKRNEANLKSLIDKGSSRVSFQEATFYDYNYLDRYNAINFRNENTVEFRLLAGTNDFGVIMKSLTFIVNFIGLLDEISNMRVDDIFCLDDFVSRSNYQGLCEDVKKLRRIDYLACHQKIFFNHFYSYNIYWYKGSINYLEVGNYILRNDIALQYHAMLDEIYMLYQQHQHERIQGLEVSINGLLMQNLMEVVLISDEVLAMSIHKGVETITLDKDALRKQYTIYKGVNNALLLSEYKVHKVY